MFGEKALELIRELERCPDTLAPFNEDKVRQVLEEMQMLFADNQTDVASTVGGETGRFAAIQFRHASLERNKRCLLAYVYNRLLRIQTMRWEFGSILPADIKGNLTEAEVRWFLQYNKMLARYMQSVGDGKGLDLTRDQKPPKSLYIEVRCLTDFGAFETDDGTIIMLKKNTQHFLPRSQCEQLIRQGILEHITF